MRFIVCNSFSVFHKPLINSQIYKHFTDYQHFTLQNSRLSLYKIEGFHFTDCKNPGKEKSLFFVIVGVIDTLHESFAIVYFIGQGVALTQKHLKTFSCNP